MTSGHPLARPRLAKGWRRVRGAGLHRSLRTKLIAGVLVITAVGLAAAAAISSAALHSYLLGKIDDQLTTFAASHSGLNHGYGNQPPIAGGSSGNGGLTGGTGGTGGLTGGAGTPDAEGTEQASPRLPSAFVVLAYSATGQYERGYSELQTQSSLPRLTTLTVARVMSLHGRPFTVDAVSGSGRWRVVAVSRGDGSIAVAQSLSDLDHTVSHLVEVEALIGACALVAMGLAGAVVIRRSLRPLVEVETTAAAIAAGDLSRRVPAMPVGTEIGRLSAAINTMLGQIESAFAHQRRSERQAWASEDRMRRFVADASHELRTPLTSIRGFAELYRMGAADTVTELPRLMRRIEDEAARMGLLVEDLLLLARLDEQRPVEHVPVDLTVVVDDVVHDARVIAPERSIALHLDGRAAVVLGDEARLRQVLTNLVVNALTHTPAEASVAVTMTRTADTVRVDVADTGPGMTPAQRDRVFERFYRADDSRSRETATGSRSGGSGLGLSIVAGLVQAHGGSVAAEENHPHGTVFTLRLPLADEPGTTRTGSQPTPPVL